MHRSPPSKSRLRSHRLLPACVLAGTLACQNAATQPLAAPTSAVMAASPGQASESPAAVDVVDVASAPSPSCSAIGHSCAPKNKVCTDAGGTAACNSAPTACEWKTTEGNMAIAAVAPGAQKIVCYAKAADNVESSIRLVKRIHEAESDNCCGTGDGKTCDKAPDGGPQGPEHVGQVGFESRGKPMLRFEVRPGTVACVQAGNRAVWTSCTPNCVP